MVASLGKSLIRTLAFCTKEISEVRRQPRLILSLVLGPLLVLMLFGAGYQGNRPSLRIALVIPAELQAELPLNEITTAVTTNFRLAGIYTEPAAAMADLRAGLVDVVEVFPADVQQRVLDGDRSVVTFRYNEINPLNEQWIQYLAYAQVSEINRALLVQAASRIQTEVGGAHQLLVDAGLNLDEIDTTLSPTQRENIQVALQQVRGALELLGALPTLFEQYSASTNNSPLTREQLETLQTNLAIIEQALAEGNLDAHQARLEATRAQIAELEETVEVIDNLPPEVLISPLQQDYENIRGRSLDFMTFYAPGVLMLILQHIAISLGALSLVRERLMGAFELYRVAPVSMFQVLAGKYVGYGLMIGLLAIILVAFLHWGLGVPFLGSALQFAALLLLFTIAALGIGFLISVAAASDSQAVQLSMLTLLLSVFFSGFVLPLNQFWEPVRVVGYLLPLTHGITGLQDIMLRGNSLSESTQFWLLGLATVTSSIVLFAAQRQRLEE